LVRASVSANINFEFEGVKEGLSLLQRPLLRALQGHYGPCT